MTVQPGETGLHRTRCRRATALLVDAVKGAQIKERGGIESGWCRVALACAPASPGYKTKICRRRYPLRHRSLVGGGRAGAQVCWRQVGRVALEAFGAPLNGHAVKVHRHGAGGGLGCAASAACRAAGAGRGRRLVSSGVWLGGAGVHPLGDEALAAQTVPLCGAGRAAKQGSGRKGRGATHGAQDRLQPAA